MTYNKLLEYGMTRVGRLEFVGHNTLQFVEEDDSIRRLECAIYAWMIGNEIVRIGATKNILRTRFLDTANHITNRLKGTAKSPTPEWEAREWHDRITRHEAAIVFARQGTMVSTPVGNFPAYLDEESVLLGRHKPPLNRSWHR